MKSDTIIIIPTYNEAFAIQKICNELLNTLKSADILIVDGASKDNTTQIISKLQENNPRVFLLKEDKKTTLSKAYKSGISWGYERRYKNFIQFDGDGTHDPRDLSNITFEDISYYKSGTREISKSPQSIYRKLITEFSKSLVNLLFKTDFKDPTSGLNIFSKKFLDQLDLANLSEAGYFIQIQLKVLAKKTETNFSEFPINFGKRWHGSSNAKFSVILDTLVGLFKFYISNEKSK